MDRQWTEGELRPVDLEGLAALVALSGSRGPCEMAFAIIDLAELIEEVRFAVGQGALIDLIMERIPVEAIEEGSKPLVMSPELQAVLTTVAGASTPSPTMIWDDLGRGIAGGRQVGPWVAAQALDSGVLRAFSALDRLATILQVAAGVPLKESKSGEIRYPTFNRQLIVQLGPRFVPPEALAEMASLCDLPAVRAGRVIRDHFVHRPRYRFAGHGMVLDGFPEGVFERPPMHKYVSLGCELYDKVLRSMVAFTIEILNHSDQGPS